MVAFFSNIPGVFCNYFDKKKAKKRKCHNLNTFTSHKRNKQHIRKLEEKPTNQPKRHDCDGLTNSQIQYTSKMYSPLYCVKMKANYCV